MAVTLIEGSRNVYRVQVRNPAGPNYDKRVTGKRAAVEREAQVRADLSRDSYVDGKAGKQPLKAYAQRWLDVQAHDRSTRELYARRFRLHVYPELGERPIGAIRHSELVGWITMLDRSMGPAQSRGVQANVRAVMRAAVADEVIARDPFRAIKLPPKPRRSVDKHVPRSMSDGLALVEAVPADLKALTSLAALTGLRRSELIGLGVDDLDLLRKRLHVRQQLLHVAGVGVYLEDPKTTESRRTVPLSEAAVEILARHLSRRPARVHLVPFGDPEAGELREIRLVFTSEAGAPIVQSTVSNRVDYARTKAGLPNGLNLHSLRHLYTTVLAEARVPQRAIDELTGHVSLGITNLVYTHVTEPMLEEARAAVQTAWAAALVGTCRKSDQATSL